MRILRTGVLPTTFHPKTEHMFPRRIVTIRSHMASIRARDNGWTFKKPIRLLYFIECGLVVIQSLLPIHTSAS